MVGRDDYPPKRPPGPLLTSSSPDGEIIRAKTSLDVLADTLELPTRGAHSVAVSVESGLAAGGRIYLQATVDGSNWFFLRFVDIDGTQRLYIDTSVDLPFYGHASVVAFDRVRLYLGIYSSGSSVATLATFSGAAVVRTLFVQPTDDHGASVPVVVIENDVVLTQSPADSSVVGAASSIIVAAHTDRTGLIIVNTSTGGQRISLGIGLPAVLDKGIVLYPYDSFCMGKYDFTTDVIYAIASAAGGAVSIQEFR